MTTLPEYRIRQDGLVVASAFGPGARKEVDHYATIYAQDGDLDVEIKRGGRWRYGWSVTTLKRAQNKEGRR